MMAENRVDVALQDVKKGAPAKKARFPWLKCSLTSPNGRDVRELHSKYARIWIVMALRAVNQVSVGQVYTFMEEGSWTLANANLEWCRRIHPSMSPHRLPLL